MTGTAKQSKVASCGLNLCNAIYDTSECSIYSPYSALSLLLARSSMILLFMISTPNHQLDPHAKKNPADTHLVASSPPQSRSP